MKIHYQALIVFVAILEGPAVADESLLERLAPGLSIEVSSVEALSALEESCADSRTISIDPPILPIAEHTEAHILCTEFPVAGEAVERVVFTFADDKLEYVYAVGNAVQPMSAMVQDDMIDYMGYAVSVNDLFLAKEDSDEIWILSPDATHVGMFQWANFLALGENAEFPIYDASVVVPSLLQFGKTIETLRPTFAELCTATSERATDTWLLTDPDEQVQIDCLGYEFGGFPRKIEAIFGDGVLEQAWLLTSGAEESRLLSRLVSHYGEPQHTTDSWYVFDDASVMLRTDKPEVLFLSDRLAPLYLQNILHEAARVSAFFDMGIAAMGRSYDDSITVANARY